mmetsp:Transcript_19216/g.38252  ORF Transcript_19216/g.38252 Transcript_19216/m.38252 type:complete len:274 (+) Transcript_19216:108-929(+)
MDIERGKIVTAAVLIPEASAVSKVTDRASALPFDKKVTESTINLNGSRTDTSNVGGITIVDEKETHTKDSVETIILPFNTPAYWSICLFTIATVFGIVSICMCALAFLDEIDHDVDDFDDDDDFDYGDMDDLDIFFANEEPYIECEYTDDFFGRSGCHRKYHYYDPAREISITYNVFTALAGLLYTVSIPLSFYSTSAYRNDASVVNQNRLGSKCLMVASWVLYGFSTLLWTSSIITVIFSSFYILHIISIVFSIISWSFMFNHSEYTRKGWK